MILLLALLMAGDAELPPEAAAKLREIRKFPAPFSSAQMLGLVEVYELKPQLAKDIAKEAYDLAMKVDRSIEVKEYPIAIEFLGGLEDAATEAWQAYMKVRDPLVDPALPFPVRPKTKAAVCNHRRVDTAYHYLKAALEANQLERAIETLRSSKELADAIEVLAEAKDGSKAVLVIELMKRLSLATESPREFEETSKMRFLKESIDKLATKLPEEDQLEVKENYRRFLNGNQRNATCEVLPERNREFDPVGFRKMKQQFVTTQWSNASGYEFLERFAELFSIAEHNEVLLDELEYSGSSYLGSLVRAFREGPPKRPVQPVPPPPPPPKR